VFFWDLFIYVIEGFVFLITGLQAARSSTRRELLAARACCCGAGDDRDRHRGPLRLGLSRHYLPRWLSPSLRKRDPSPPGP